MKAGRFYADVQARTRLRGIWARGGRLRKGRRQEGGKVGCGALHGAAAVVMSVSIRQAGQRERERDEGGGRDGRRMREERE
eukprot:1247880-Pleurochrysis_carterae.AAC.1